jgi:hypothetical protein
MFLTLLTSTCYNLHLFLVNHVGVNTMSKLTTVEKTELILGSLPMSYIAMAGSKLNKMIRYTMEVVNTNPYELAIYLNTTKSKEGKKQIVKQHLLTIKAGNNTLYVTDHNDLPLSNTEKFESYIDGKLREFSSHLEVIYRLALPHWIDKADSYVENNQSAPYWLVIAMLWNNVRVNQPTDEFNIKTAQSFTQSDFFHAILDAHNALPTNEQLRLAAMRVPEDFKKSLNSASNTTIDTTVIDSSTTEVYSNPNNITENATSTLSRHQYIKEILELQAKLPSDQHQYNNKQLGQLKIDQLKPIYDAMLIEVANSSNNQA